MNRSHDVQKATEWFDQWGVYRSIVDNNWTFHDEIHNAIRDFALKQEPGPFALLDLGCGDAGFIERTFTGTHVRAYTVVDDASQSPDISMAGYAVHHLGLPDKRRFFTLAMMNAQWELTPEGLDGTSRHVQDCDFPETQETIIHLARDAGFTNSPLEPFTDQQGFHRLLVFMK